MYAMIALTSASQSHTEDDFGSLALLPGASSGGSDLAPQTRKQAAAVGKSLR